MTSLDGLKTTVVSLIQRGLDWWLGELSSLVPRRFRADQAAAPAILEVSAAEAALVLTDRTAAPPLRITIGGTGSPDERAQVRAAMRRHASDAVIVKLDRSLVLDANITLPANAERSLRPILRNQLERLVPLSADEVEFEYQITSRSAANRSLGVRLIIATHASLERALATARAVGLAPRAVIATGAGSDSIVTLWRAGRDESLSPRQRWLQRGLEIAAVVLLVTAYATYVYRLGDMRDQLQQDVAVATKASAAARDLLNRSAATDKALAVLQRRKQELHPLMLLDEVTQLVPQTAWVTQLMVRGRNVEIIGYSPRVAELISRIEDHDVFYEPKFRSPITMSPDGKGERFDLSFDIWIGDKK